MSISPEGIRSKIQDVLTGVQLAAFASVTPEGAPQARYVMVMTDEDLTLRFATHLDAPKVDRVKANPKVHLLCGITSLETARHWVEVDGTAEVRTDPETRHAIWFDPLARYFSGPDDPNLAVIVVHPDRVTYHSMDQNAPQIWEP